MGFYPSSYPLELNFIMVCVEAIHEQVASGVVHLADEMSVKWEQKFYKPLPSWSHCIDLSCDWQWERLAGRGCFHVIPPKSQSFYSLTSLLL